jgi:predicted nucleic acid-binding protein
VEKRKSGLRREKVYLLDSSALISFAEGEEGSEVVEKIMREASENRVRALISFMSLMECYYWILKQEGDESARDFYLYLKTLPIERIDLNERLIIKAGEIKAHYPINIAKAWIIASAIEAKAILVHKDPGFETVSQLVPFLSLIKQG